jgi:uncharacterized OsmC-like protein
MAMKMEMQDVKARTRPTGVTATLRPGETPHLTSVTGGELDIVTAPSQAGFNPLDLLYASLSGCLVLSARMAATQLGVADKLGTITAEVSGEKAPDGPSRVAQFKIVFTIEGDIDDETRHAIIAAAEDEICTVSNTIRGNPSFVTTTR